MTYRTAPGARLPWLFVCLLPGAAAALAGGCCVWFLPALTLSTAIAVALIRRADRHPWAATRAAVVHLGFLLAVSAFLATQGFDAPRLPLVVAPAFALELVGHRTRRAWPAAAAFVVGVFAVYGPVRGLSAADLAFGFPLALVAGVVVLVGWRPLPAARTVAAGAAVLLVGLAGTASAHDPGQGKDAGTVAWHLTAYGEAIAADVVVPTRGSCTSVVPHDLVARRGGRVIRAPERRRGCHLLGRLRVDERGRWFVYADLHRRRETVESWVPVKVGSDGAVVNESRRFAYQPRRRPATWPKYIAGVVLYGALLAVLAAMARLSGRAPA